MGQSFLCPLHSFLKLYKLFIACLATSVLLLGQAVVTTQHNDLNRSGAILNETILNTSNVNVNTFGKLFSRAVDGQIYAQPLYVPNLLIPGQGVHNVVYICTENDSVYAFDADLPGAANPLWQVSLGTALPASVIGATDNLIPQIGVSGTPTIDLSSNTLYVVAETYEHGTEVFRLHALDITTGAEKLSGPVVISGSVSTSTGTLAFSPNLHWQRPGLLLLNDTVYIGFGSHLDASSFHGWVIGYNSTTLQQTAIRCITPNALEGGVWQGGAGLVADADGFMYVQTGNGTMDANTGGSDYADSIVKLDTNNALTVVDYFSPSNQLSLAGGDVDFGAGGPILIPGTSLIVGGGKDGKLFLLNTANLGHFNMVDQSVQEWQATYSLITNGSGGFFGGNAFYNSTLYVWGRRDVLKAWSFNGSTFNTTPTLGPDVVPDDYSNEPGLSISANGTAAGSGILWAFHSAVAGGADGQPHPGVLRAFDASNIANELWNSNQNQTRDYSGSWAKWDPPTIANGKVYLPTFDNVVNVFGLLSGNSSGHLLGNGNSSSAAVNLTTEGDSDWEHWGTDGLNRKSGVTAQLSTYTLVGSGNASAYTGDPRPLGWSDGTPDRSNASDLDGVQVSGIGNGFSIVAPADTVIRTLVIHAGGQNSGGSLTAHLSDGSAADFRDTTTTASGRYDRNYTFTYGAAAAGQTLTVKWTMLSGTGNVTLSAATLGGSTITASGGTPQSAHVNLAFASALQATVKDAGGNPINGAVVTFTLPDSGASGIFGGSNIVTTNSSGLATAPTLTANAIAGPYNVTASLAGLAGSANFSLTNLAPLGSGTLSGSGNSSAGTVNLTAEGTVDWEHWGDTNLNHKNGVTPVLSTYTEVGNGSLLSYPNDPRPISWTDGTPAATATNDTNGVYVQGIGNGFSLTAPADGSSRTLVVHVGGWNSGGTLTAHLSDGSAADFTDTTATASGIYERNYTLTYSASGPGQTLKVTWVMVSGTGNVNISAAALGSASGSISATAGTPQSTTVSSNFATALQATVKDSSGNPMSGVSVTFTAPGTGPSGTFSGSVTASSNTNSNGVATAPTLTANSQAGGPYTVTAMVSGVATEADFSLTNTGGTPASIATTAGTPQSATVSTNFATALRATVKDSIGNPVGGVSVTFTAPPGTGPSGAFSGSATASSTTNSSGLAIAPTLTANNLAGGPYTVTATVAGVATPANFSLTNTAGTTGGGSLVGSGNSLATLMNLTSEGTTDWEHWGDSSLNRKKGVTAQLSTYTVVGTKGVLVYDNDLRPIAWNDGTPTAGAVGDTNGTYIPGLGQGFSFTAPADTTTRTLVVHVGGWNSGGTFTASLSDGSAGDFTDTTAVDSGQYDRNYTLTYSAGSPSQTLTITWTMTSGVGNVTLNGAALSSASGSITASAGTSQSATINTAFATALQATVKDSSGNPVGGVSVTFTTPGTGPSGTFSGLVTASSNTNSSGVATAPTLTANSQVGGPYTVTATVSGVATAANFSLTNTGGTPASIITTAGTPQSAAVSSNFATALQATVKDSSGNPMSGVSVTFTAPGTGPSGTFSGSVSASRNTNSSGVATAPTLTANSQAGGPYTVTAMVSGVATAANFRLTNTAGTPASITTTAGTPQSVTVSTNFATALQATVKDSSGNPVGGVSVTFTAPPGTRPSGTFSGSATASSNTNSSGVATAPGLTANSLAGGPYTVTATVAAVATPANFRLTNTAGTTGGGSLVGSGNSAATLINLTSEGTTDWEHWGDASLNRKKGVTAQLSDYTVVGTHNVLSYSNDLRPISWSDGTPTASAVSDTNGFYLPGLNQGFSFTAPADTTTRTLVVHVGGWNSGGTLTASLSDGSAGDFTDTTAVDSGQYDRNYTLTYSAGSPSQTLTITWKMTSGIGNVTLNGAALSGGSSGGSQGSLTGAGNSSQSLIDLTSEGPTDWEHWGDSSLNHKAGVTAQLSTYTVVGTKGVLVYDNDLRPIAWSDGTPTASAVSDTNGIYIQGLGQGFSFTAPADTTSRTLLVHVGGWNSGGTLTASLSDGSAANFTDVTANNSGQYDRNYTLTYNAGSASQTLTITWTMTSGVGNVTLNAAALQ